MAEDNQLVPLLREGINIIKIITYKMIKEHLSGQVGDIKPEDVNKMSGVVINIIFGTPNTADESQNKQIQYQDEIQAVIDQLPTILGEFCNTITDTLRIQILCDGHNNIDSTPILKQAEQLKILNKDRELPLPNDFTALVRELGAKHHLLAPMQ